jgi:hypothetical protein
MNLIALAYFMSAMPGAPISKSETACPYEEEAFLALGIDSFDQSRDKGWRRLASRPECRAVAANLIEIYRRYVESRLTSLYWHEGQLRAELGQTELAISVFEKARHVNNLDGWNFYVDATVAFLCQQKPDLLKARANLAAVSVPKNYRSIGLDGKLIEGRPQGWPYNLDVVDGFINCFEKAYSEAYSLNCRALGKSN